MDNGYSIFSFSGLSALGQCGHLFRLTRLDKVPETGSFAQHSGSAFHSAADLIDMLLMEEQDRDQEVPF